AHEMRRRAVVGRGRDFAPVDFKQVLLVHRVVAPSIVIACDKREAFAPGSPCDDAIHFAVPKAGLLRFARNDGLLKPINPAPAAGGPSPGSSRVFSRCRACRAAS